MLAKWEKLPPEMQVSEVRRYYDVLKSKPASLFLKRTIDLLFSAVAILVVFFPSLLVALLIKLDSKGPVLFKQVRVGAGKKNFRILKFRTMVSNADKMGVQVSTANDTRITKFGKLLRKSKLDEAPQLVNVFLGNMTLVGTRPEVPKYVEKYNSEMLATLLLPPGITSQTSIDFRYENDMLDNAENPEQVYIEKILPEKMKTNLKHLENFGLLNDAKTVIDTFLCLFKR